MSDRSIYEYAGFQYYITPVGEGRMKMIPVPGQHRAAFKHRHLHAALEQYEQEQQATLRRKSKSDIR